MSEYLNKLISQFKQATGVKNIDVNSESFVKEFSDWIIGRKLIISSYQKFINYLSDKPCLGSASVEIGKGKYDSIVVNCNVSMITPYTDGIIKKEGRLIKGNFFVFESIPMVVAENDEIIEKFVCSNYNRFITQNPYSPNNLDDWERLHNAGGNITVGVYGSIYDKDVDSKIKLINDLRTKLFGGFVSEYSTDKDNYMYVVSSRRKVKEKVLIKTRSRHISY